MKSAEDMVREIYLFDLGTLGLWDVSTFELWDFGTFGLFDVSTLGLLNLARCAGPWDFGTC